MIVRCPSCGRNVSPDVVDQCPACGCEVAILGQVLVAAHDSLQLAMLALMEGRDKDAHDFAYEAWALRHTTETSAVGLLAAIALGEPIEISRWLRRRRRLFEGS
jgi:hypothetical protein